MDLSYGSQGKFGSTTAAAGPHKLPRGLSIIPTSKSKSIGSEKPVNGLPKSMTNKRPPKSIENQSMVNIAGIKYLIVPHPPERAKSTSKSHMKESDKSNSQKLPFLLKPSNDAPQEMPIFEVEETPEGKLLLVPSSGPLKKGENPFKTNKMVRV